MSSVALLGETFRKDTLLLDAMGSSSAGVRVHVRVEFVGTDGINGYAVIVEANSCVGMCEYDFWWELAMFVVSAVKT